MKNAQCKKCQNKFQEKDIYTIQQFQYRKQSSYDWSVNYFKKNCKLISRILFVKNASKNMLMNHIKIGKTTRHLNSLF